MKNSIAERRADQGLSQGALAEKLSVSRQTVNALERGRYNPSLDLAFKLAAVFEARIEEIFEPDGPL